MAPTPACVSCYTAKVKCHEERPCPRCVRLNVECVSRTSRQGQGPKKRKWRQQQEQQSSAPGAAGGGGAAKSEDEVIASQMGHHHRHHYGVLYLIHQWINTAFVRKSFGLLSRACQLANKCGVPMDDVFNKTKKDVLDPVMYRPASIAVPGAQFQTTQPLQWSDLPPRLLEVCKIADDDDTTSSRCRRSERYIMVREAKHGDSRYLLSENFDRHVCSLWTIEQTWKANEKPVVRLFLHGQRDFDLFTKGVNYQMSRYHDPSVSPECARLNDLKVKMKSGSIQSMDLIYTFEIINLNHSYYVSEFIPRRQKEDDKSPDTTTTKKEQSPASNGNDETNANNAYDEEELQPLPLFGDLEDLQIDEDLRAFLNLIGES